MTRLVEPMLAGIELTLVLRALVLPFLMAMTILVLLVLFGLVLLGVERIRRRVRKTLWMAIEALDEGALSGTSLRNQKTVRGVRFQTGSAGYDAVFGKPSEPGKPDPIDPDPIELDQSDLIDPHEFEELLQTPPRARGASWGNNVPTQLIPFDVEMMARLSAKDPDPHAMGCEGYESGTTLESQKRQVAG